MYLRALKQVAQAALHLSGSERIIVVGSASLMATFGELGGPGQLLEKTLDADLVLDPDDEELARLVYEAMGPGERFEDRFGCHVDVLRAEFGDSLPPGWKDRLVPLADCENIWCLEPHDLAVAKLFACRPKDLMVLSALLATGRLDAGTVRERLRQTPMREALIVRTHDGLTRAERMAAEGPDGDQIFANKF